MDRHHSYLKRCSFVLLSVVLVLVYLQQVVFETSPAVMKAPFNNAEVFVDALDSSVFEVKPLVVTPFFRQLHVSPKFFDIKSIALKVYLSKFNVFENRREIVRSLFYRESPDEVIRKLRGNLLGMDLHEFNQKNFVLARMGALDLLGELASMNNELVQEVDRMQAEDVLAEIIAHDLNENYAEDIKRLFIVEKMESMQALFVINPHRAVQYIAEEPNLRLKTLYQNSIGNAVAENQNLEQDFPQWF